MTSTDYISRFDFDRIVGEAHTVIRVQNLQCTGNVGTDAWGRKGVSKPILISATVVLKDEFESAAQTDQVNHSTVHYGILSKALLATAQTFHETHGEDEPSGGFTQFTEMLYNGLLEHQLFRFSAFKALEITVTLPKASLLGTGVSYTVAQADFRESPSVNKSNLHTVAKYCNASFKIHNLDIPTIIGVNAVERLAKQRVVTNVEIDRLDFDTFYQKDPCHNYCELEQLIVKTVDESSFETLESLAEHLSRRILYHHIYPGLVGAEQDGTHNVKSLSRRCDDPKFHTWPKVKITLAKPTAVTFADSPAIEIIRSSAPTANRKNRELWNQFGRRQPPRIPFPFLGNLEEWIENHPSRFDDNSPRDNEGKLRGFSFLEVHESGSVTVSDTEEPRGVKRERSAEEFQQRNIRSHQV